MTETATPEGKFRKQSCRGIDLDSFFLPFTLRSIRFLLDLGRSFQTVRVWTL
jgi:hypothetical protein